MSEPPKLEAGRQQSFLNVLSFARLNGGEWHKIWIDYNQYHVRFMINTDYQMLDLLPEEEFGPFEGSMYIGGATLLVLAEGTEHIVNYLCVWGSFIPLQRVCLLWKGVCKAPWQICSIKYIYFESVSTEESNSRGEQSVYLSVCMPGCLSVFRLSCLSSFTNLQEHRTFGKSFSLVMAAANCQL